MRVKWTVVGLVAFVVAYLVAIRLTLIIPAELVPVNPDLLGWVLAPVLFFTFLGLVVLWQVRQNPHGADPGSEQN